MYYEHHVRLAGIDVDGRGYCKASALLNHLQVAATLAAEEGGFGRDVLIDRYRAFWMLARSWYRLSRPLHWEDDILIRTWHRGNNGAKSYRDYDIYANGQRVGESVASWILANLDTHKLMRLSGVEEMAATSGGSLCKTITLSKLRAPAELQEVERRLMRYSDTDINGHVNNTRYADFACDALELAGLEEDCFLSSMQIGYLAECRPGEYITMETGVLEEGRYVRGLDKMGKPRFEASLIFGKVSP